MYFAMRMLESQEASRNNRDDVCRNGVEKQECAISMVTDLARC